MSKATTIQPVYDQISDGKNGKAVYVWHAEGQVLGDATGGTMAIAAFEDRKDKYARLVYNRETLSFFGTLNLLADVLDYYYRGGLTTSTLFSIVLQAGATGVATVPWTINQDQYRRMLMTPSPNLATGVYLGSVRAVNVNGGDITLSVGGFAWLRSELDAGRILQRPIR